MYRLWVMLPVTTVLLLVLTSDVITDVIAESRQASMSNKLTDQVFGGQKPALVQHSLAGFGQKGGPGDHLKSK